MITPYQEAVECKVTSFQNLACFFIHTIMLQVCRVVNEVLPLKKSIPRYQFR
jgi:hypothetical protein